MKLPFSLPGIDGPGEIRVANAVYVTPDFLETLDIPLLNGRDLEPADGPEAPRVVLVNRAFVDAYLDGSVSLGTPIDLRDGYQWAVVGIVGDVQQTPGFGDGGPIQTSPTIYMPAAQADGSFFQAIHIWFSPSWLVRGTGDPSEWGPEVTRAMESVNPDMPVARIAPLDRIVDNALAQPRLGATFLSW